MHKNTVVIGLFQRLLDSVLRGDCLEILKHIPPNSIDLVVTSPPYAECRKKTYGGIHPDDYVEWFLPRALAIKRVLKPEGTFILNVKEKTYNGERHAYVLSLIHI